LLAVVSFDATDPARLDRLVAEGRMPVLERLRREGRAHRVGVPARDRLMEESSFHTLATGVGPERHGRILAYGWDARRMRAAVPGPEAVPTVWERATAAGRRSLVLDAYAVPAPAGRVDGAFLRGLQQDNRVSVPIAAMPRGLWRDARRALGRAPLGNEIYGRPTAGELVRERDRMLRAALRPAEAVELLLPRVGPDLLWIPILAGHMAGHRFWDLSQARTRPTERQAERLEGVVDDVYALCDQSVGRILAALPAGADAMVLSPVGMGPNTSRVDLLDGMLAAVLGSEAAGSDRSIEAGGLWRLRGAATPRLRARVAGALPDRAAVELMLRMSTPRRDWSQTKAFVVPGEPHGFVRLNLSGREAAGSVAPSDADALVAELKEALTAFEDLEGGPAVAAVHDVRDLAGTAPDAHLPDVIVEWAERPSTAVTGVRSPVHGTVRRAGGPGGPTGRSGNHRADAWMIVLPGEGHAALDVEGPGLTDVAATAAALLECESEGLEGRPLIGRLKA
jgi:predicted AlkP superfamily phosphohydrolase/phosphomutase